MAARLLRRQKKDRLFCITGAKQSRDQSPPYSSQESDCSSSGYLSSSSLESSVEEKRLHVDGSKVFQVWQRMDRHMQTPKASTPVREAENSTSVIDPITKRRSSLSLCSTGSGKKSLLSIRKSIGEPKSRRKHVQDQTVSTNRAVICDLQSRYAESVSGQQGERVQRNGERARPPKAPASLQHSHRSGGDVHMRRRPLNQLHSELAGSEFDLTKIDSRNALPRQRSRSVVRSTLVDTSVRRDVEVLEDTRVSRTSRRDLLPRQRPASSSRNTQVKLDHGARDSQRDGLPRQRARSILRDTNTQRDGGRRDCQRDALPRHRSRSAHRVTFEDTPSRVTRVAHDDSLLSSPSARLGKGLSVDESMSEFLSNVDMDNLASFLNFYDRVTSNRSRKACVPSELGQLRNEV